MKKSEHPASVPVTTPVVHPMVPENYLVYAFGEVGWRLAVIRADGGLDSLATYDHGIVDAFRCAGPAEVWSAFLYAVTTGKRPIHASDARFAVSMLANEGASQSDKAGK